MRLSRRTWLLILAFMVLLAVMVPRVRADDDDEEEEVADAETVADADADEYADTTAGGGGGQQDATEMPVSFSMISDIQLAAEFPNNPFKTIVVGERTSLVINVTNVSEEKEYAVAAVWGHFVNPQNFSNVVRNLTGLRYSVPLPLGETQTLEYTLELDMDPIELGLVVLVAVSSLDAETGLNETKTAGVAFQGLVRIVEGEFSYLNLQMLILYAVLGAIGYGLYLLAWSTLFPESSRPKKKPRAAPAPAATSGSKSDGGAPQAKPTLDSEWIPQHVREVHQPKQRKKGGKTSEGDRSS